MQTEIQTVTDTSPRRALWKLASCEDFFDRDYETLILAVENQQLKFAWDIAAPGTARREVRVWRSAALSEFRQQPFPRVTEDDVYRLLLPNRDLKSTELERILSCTHQHIYALAPLWRVVRAPAAADGPNSFTIFDRNSVVSFLRSRRLS